MDPATIVRKAAKSSPGMNSWAILNVPCGTGICFRAGQALYSESRRDGIAHQLIGGHRKEDFASWCLDIRMPFGVATGKQLSMRFRISEGKSHTFAISKRELQSS
jgi:hypothetical protein